MRKFNFWTSKFLIVFGFIWLLVEPAGLFFEDVSKLGWAGYIGIIVVSTITTAALFWPKRRATKHFTDANTTITVSSSDILDQTGSIVIAVSDTFDTEIGDIINKDSLIGQLLLTRYSGDSSRANFDIEKALAGKDGHEDCSKIFGKKLRYPIGTVAPLIQGDSTYFLLAMNEMMAKEKRVKTDLRKIGVALDSAWESIRSNGNHCPAHIPLVGTRFGRSGLTPLFVAQLIVSFFLIASRTEQVAPELTIHVHRSNASTFDFNAMQSWLNSVSHQNG
tara:strand:+ start:1341 stop:2171 length:831 start_codon:yes stop_codon:yes gene_type:complete